jgi:hypothetical protein
VRSFARLLVLTVSLSLIAQPAHAVLLPNGDVAWTFEGHGSIPLDSTQHVISGTLEFSNAVGGTASLHASIDGVPDAIVGFTQPSSLQVQDGAPGSPDFVFVNKLDTLLMAPSILQPMDPIHWGAGMMQIQLTDRDGTAWSGLDGLLPPPNPPDASVFEIRSIDIFQQHCEDFGNGTCASPGDGSPQWMYEIIIDSFVPEAGCGAGCALVLAALLAARLSSSPVRA